MYGVRCLMYASINYFTFYRAAGRAKSNADFINTLKIGGEELDPKERKRLI